MEKKYNIQLNPNKLSKEQIDKHKDFDALLKRYRTSPERPKPIYRRMVFWTTALAVAASLALLLVYTGVFSGNGNDYQKKMADYFRAERPFIDRPLQQVKKEFASFDVDVNQGGVFEYPSGSKLTVQ